MKPESPDLIVGTDGLARPHWASSNQLLRDYYDTEWGMPVRDEQGIFERLSLEAFQSGLSWATVLQKRPAFRELFSNFDPEIISKFGDSEINSLLQDARIIRNRNKILATIGNAQATMAMRDEVNLADYVWSFRPSTTPSPTCQSQVPSTTPESIALATGLRKRGFKFVGPTTMFALMEAIGIVDTHLVGAHRRGSSGIW